MKENKNEKYELIKKEMPTISKIISTFPEAIQEKAYNTLINTLLGTNLTVGTNAQLNLEGTINQDISLITEKGPNGKFQFNDIDLKAKNRSDAVLRLVCIAVRAYEKVMGELRVSKKTIINPLMKKWGFIAGSDRRAFANIRGLHNEGDNYFLDIPAKQQADKYIEDVLNPEIKGFWNPSIRTRKKGVKQTKTKSK